ncbi:hypothetical protein WOLCODRAFT_16734 [Wolfiporia cocos MD-104 SS10]|uniref:Uncharacterized protein n=1 Tax=Wolfiporia cocos (strain MD-104) TaxID=742152 RepID=A0A2H3JF67_WOLCO|nr:hypothetical protein WOLCODRAFT_16734 [Wolfiporia cocos MD-104 SS10]
MNNLGMRLERQLSLSTIEKANLNTTISSFPQAQSSATNSSAIPEASTAPLEPDVQQQFAESDPQQQFAKLLSDNGIKARDFAYESTLPPIPSVPYIRVQYPDLPRGRRATEEEQDDYEGKTFYIDAETGGSTTGLPPKSKPRTIERTPTEPLLEEELRVPVRSLKRTIGGATMLKREPAFTGLSPALLASPRRPAQALANTLGEGCSPQPELEGTSQETEAWGETPLVTPIGTPQRPIIVTSAVPESQINTLSRLPQVDGIAHPHLGLTPERLSCYGPMIQSQQSLVPSLESLVRDEDMLGSSSLLAPLSWPTAHTPSSDPESPPRKKGRLTPRKMRHRPTDSPVINANRATRYHLRNRTVDAVPADEQDHSPLPSSSRHLSPSQARRAL